MKRSGVACPERSGKTLAGVVEGMMDSSRNADTKSVICFPEESETSGWHTASLLYSDFLHHKQDVANSFLEPGM